MEVAIAADTTSSSAVRRQGVKSALLTVPIVAICSYVFLKTMKPSEDYLTPYLVHDKGLTEAQTYDDVYPVWTYAAAVLTVVIFLVADAIGYKTVVLLEALAYEGTRLFLLWGGTVLDMQWMQGLYALATSSELGYSSYAYAMAPPQAFVAVTAAVKASHLAGQVVASLIAQVMVSKQGEAAYRPLNWIAFASVTAAVVVAVALPRVVRRNAALGGDGYQLMADAAAIKAGAGSVRSDPVGPSAWQTFRLFYGKPANVLWCFWAIGATCGLYQVENYIQNLWSVHTDEHSQWNGIANIGAASLGAIAACVPPCLPASLVQRIAAGWMALASIVAGTLLIAMAQVPAPVVAYCGYVVFKALVVATLVLANARIAVAAAAISQRRYGLIYGFNTMLAMGVETVLQLVVGKHCLHLNVNQQFTVYGGLFAGLALPFLAKLVQSRNKASQP